MFGLLLAAGLALGHEPVKAQVTSYMIDVSVFQGDPLGSRAEGNVKWLTEARVVVQAGRPAFFQSGRQVSAGDTVVDCGVRVRLTPSPGPEGTIRVVAEFTQSEPSPGLGILAQGKLFPGFTEQSLRTNLEMKPGMKARQRIAARSATDQTWAEVTVRPVE